MSIAAPDPIHYRLLQPDQPTGKPPLVLLHGVMGFAANWGKTWPYFIQERPVLTLDQRGHGRSFKPAHGYSPTDYAGDLLRLLDSLGLSRVHVVGHSMGGRVALRFATLYRDRCVSLTMEDSGAESRPERVDWIKNLIGRVPTPFPDRESARRYFEENFRDDPITGGFLHANLEPKSDGGFDWRFYRPGMVETIETGRATDGMEEFRALTLPTLLIRGGKSQEFPAAEAARMRDSRSNVRLVTVEGAGHLVHAEKPQAFCEALGTFLNEVEAATSS